MGHPHRQFLAISLMMRYADIEATRDLDRGAPAWPGFDDGDADLVATGTSTTVPLVDSRPAA